MGWRAALAFIAICLTLIFFRFNQYRRSQKSEPTLRSRTFWLLAVLLYLASGLSHIAPYLSDANRILVDQIGRHWHSSDLRESAVIVMLMTMLPSGLIAILRLYQPR